MKPYLKHWVDLHNYKPATKRGRENKRSKRSKSRRGTRTAARMFIKLQNKTSS